MALLTAETRIVRSSEIVTAEMDDNLVMMSIQHSHYFGLSNVARFIWETIETPHTLGEITAKVCEEFDIDEATCGADVLSFSTELLEQDLIATC